uniref:Protein DEK isoform X1 n=1 Tax=Rhizophora mucronata TaxID=61149 RepID=A0A2P2LBG3_RHIMU
MASETLEENKQEEEAPVGGREEEEKAKAEGVEERAEKGEKENLEVLEKEENDELEDGKGQEEKKKVEEAEGEEVKQEAKGKKAGKQGARKKKEPGESKKSKQDSAAEKPGEEESEKKEKESVTPASERPTRERKIVERYSAPEPGRSSAAKPLSIEKGSGTQLKDIPNVAFKLSKRKLDDNLQMLHTILFGKKAKAHNLKKNIGQFSGYVWAENEEKQKAKVREKLDKCVKEKLIDLCDVLNIPINKATVRKEELTVKILEFLESPHATTDVLLADKE